MASDDTTAGLLAQLEAISRGRADRVLRLRGSLPAGPDREAPEAFELLIFRGFSSSTTHPTAFDPDRPALPEGSVIRGVELLQGPLRPDQEVVLRETGTVEDFLEAGGWQ